METKTRTLAVDEARLLGAQSIGPTGVKVGGKPSINVDKSKLLGIECVEPAAAKIGVKVGLKPGYPQ